MSNKSRSRHFQCVLLALLLAVSGRILAQRAHEGELSAERLAKAKAMFQERCKNNSGEKIHHIINKVEGIFLIKIRPEETDNSNQFSLNDPYGHDSTGTRYIESFLLGRGPGGYLTKTGKISSFGYRYVEAIDSKDGKRYRYTSEKKTVGKQNADSYNNQVELKRDPNYDLNIYALVVNQAPASGTPPRYGVTYDDISTPEEREYWIAGSSLKVIDLETNNVIAERIGYMVDLQQGDRSGGRSPWLLAADNACPSFRSNTARSGVPGFSYQVGQSRNFVEKVLKPVQGR